MAGTPSSSIASSGAGAITQIYDNVAAGAIASWSVSGIAQTYTHLQVVIAARGDTAALVTTVLARFNGDSGANYYAEQIQAVAAGVTASEQIAGTSIRVGACSAGTGLASTASAITFFVPNYAGTTFKKNLAGVGANSYGTASTNTVQELPSGFWNNAAAITQITILPGAGNFVAGSRLSIYGIT